MTRWFVLAAALAGFAALAAFFPAKWAASLALPDNVRAQAKFTGTIWHGAVIPNAKFGLSPIRYAVSPKAVIGGGDYLSFQSSGALSLRGSGSHKRLQSLNISGPLQAFGPTDPRLGGLLGDVQLNVQDFIFEPFCESGTGMASTDILARNQAYLNWTGPILSGPLSCQNGILTANLTGAQGAQRIDLTLQFSGNGTYRADIDVTSPEPDIAPYLQGFGFSGDARRLSLAETGNWR